MSPRVPLASPKALSLDRCFFRYTRHLFSRLLSQNKFISSSMQTTRNFICMALLPSSYTHDISTLQSCLDSLHICFLANVNSRSRFSERELTFTFAICCRPSVCRLSVCRLSSVTFVRPTQAVQMFGNISTALGTLAIH